MTSKPGLICIVQKSNNQNKSKHSTEWAGAHSASVLDVRKKMKMRESLDNWRDVAQSIAFSLPACITELAAILRREAHVIEVGCGYGRVCRELCDNGFNDVIGYDVSAAMIERGHTEFPELALRHNSKGPIPKQDCSVDAVVCCALLTSIPDPEERHFVVRECYRVLRHGGILHLIEFTRSNNRVYDEDGSFLSGLGIRMIHLSMDQLMSEVNPFHTITMKCIECQSVSGSVENAILFQGRKTANQSIEGQSIQPPRD